MSTDRREIARILADPGPIAVVGASPHEDRPSYMVSRYLVEHGFTVIPVRPRFSEVMGLRCYERLEDIPEQVDIVDVFRRPEACPAIAASAVSVGARTLWLQQGIVSEEAAAIAAAGGLNVVMDLCIKTAHQGLPASERGVG
jgi:predicted CoA-binding protein